MQTADIKPRGTGKDIISFRIGKTEMDKITLLSQKLDASRSEVVRACIKTAIDALLEEDE